MQIEFPFKGLRKWLITLAVCGALIDFGGASATFRLSPEQKMMFTIVTIVTILCIGGIIACGLLFKVPEGYLALKGSSIYQPGWNFGLPSGARLMDAAKHTIHLDPQRLTFPDGAALDMTVSITYSPDLTNISSYIKNGQERGVAESFLTDVPARLSKWANSRTEGPQTWQKGLESAAHNEAEEILIEEITGTPREGLVPVEARLMKLGYKADDLGIVVYRVVITDVKPVTGQQPLKDVMRDEKDADTIVSETEIKVKKLRDLEAKRATMKKENPELADDIDRMMDEARSRILEHR
jgi:hypothetical protein